jgi:putative transport protein
MSLLNAWLKPKIEQPAAQQLVTAEIALRNSSFFGKGFPKLVAMLPAGVAIAAIRRQGHNLLPSDTLTVSEGDALLATATNQAALDAAVTLLGEVQTGSIATDRQDLDYFRLFISKPSVVGQALGDLVFPSGADCSVIQVRRGDSDLMPSPDLILEAGDRVGVLVNRANAKTIQAFFGDSIKGTADLRFISIGIGAALGLLIGLIPLPVPGVGKLTLGLAGLLLVALFLGKARRTGPFVWTMPLSANLVLRNFGLTIFLAQVGLASGPKFFATIGTTGISYLLYGALIALSLILITAALCLWVFRLPFDTSLGVISGATGNPAILAFASRITPTERPDVGYAMIFPSMTILKIIFVQVAAALLGG